MKCFFSISISIFLILGFLFFNISNPWSAKIQPGPCLELRSFFTRSLHFTGNGMKYWYQEPDGFMSLTGIPYENLYCTSCHVKSCDTCHAQTKQGQTWFSKDKVRDIKTCFQCHTREKLNYMEDKKRGKLDVHRKAGMVCADCHKSYQIHGDGRVHLSMREPEAERTGCLDCHKEMDSQDTGYNENLLTHRIHGDKLDCAACHVSNTMTCYNCHFDSVLESDQKKGNFIPIKSWTLLINYNGRVTSGSVMTIVYQDKKFIAYVPYFSHSVSSSGRTCQDCHANNAVISMEKEEKFKVVDYQNGKVKGHEGVIPVIPEKLEWTFFNKTKTGWQPLKNKTKIHTQFAAYGRPLSEQQYKMLLQTMEARMFLKR